MVMAFYSLMRSHPEGLNEEQIKENLVSLLGSTSYFLVLFLLFYCLFYFILSYFIFFLFFFGFNCCLM